MKFSFRRKFLLIVLMLAVIPLLLVSTFSFLGSRGALLETISENNTSSTLSAARGMRDQVLSFRSVLESTARSVAVAKTNEDKKDVLLGLEEGFVSIKSLAILDKTGKEIIRSDDKPLNDKGDHPEFYVAKNKGFYFS